MKVSIKRSAPVFTLELDAHELAEILLASFQGATGPLDTRPHVRIVGGGGRLTRFIGRTEDLQVDRTRSLEAIAAALANGDLSV